jgi:hypothetical protein
LAAATLAAIEFIASDYANSVAEFVGSESESQIRASCEALARHAINWKQTSERLRAADRVCAKQRRWHERRIPKRIRWTFGRDIFWTFSRRGRFGR